MKVSTRYMVLQVLVSIFYNVYAAAPSNSLYSSDNYISDNVENLTAIANTTLLLKCPKRSGEIHWMLTTELNDISDHMLETNSDTYELRPVTPQDKGVYICLEGGSRIIKKFNLTVLEPPYFIKKMRKLKAKRVGMANKLSCKAGGTPTPNITWYRENKTPPKREEGAVRTNHWSLSWEDTNIHDHGNYTCVVCNVAGCINFTYFVITYFSCPIKPFIKDGYPQNLTVVENRVATFECPQVFTHIDVSIQWVRLGNNFDESDAINSTSVLQTSDRGTSKPEIFQIVNVTREDEGWYACFASNYGGTSMSKAYLQVVDEEPTYEVKLTTT